MGHSKLRQVLVCTICQLSVMVAGAAYSWFEPITIRLSEDADLNFTAEDISWLVSVMELSGILGPLAAGELTNRIGRKMTIMSIGPLSLLGWVLVLFSKSMTSLIVVRLLHGLATGVAFTIPPIYAAEIAEPNLRGRLSGIFHITLYLGMLYVFASGPYLSYDMYVYVCIPLPIIFTIVWMFMPETPYYFLMKEREDKAREVLKSFREGEVEEELKEMKNAVDEEMSTQGSWKTLLFDKVERRAFIIVQIVCTTKYLSGISVITNYALETFSMSESFLSPEGMSILLAILLILIAVLSAFMSDWIGRRPLILWSCFGGFVGHFLTGAYYYIHEKTTIDSSNFTWALYVGMSMSCFFCDIGIGPLLQTLQSEMFGASTRGIAGGFTEGYAGLLSFFLLKVYTPVNETFGIFANFWFYSLVNLFGGFLLFWMFYETAGKTIGKMVDKEQKINSFL